ncbi:uncharacterized protein K452DRAFT_347550 [Aplosporella prunicola CBS 121167]|uniref:Uncharacterized protein n=1 Tax=Aplosporella prunicola CBS 121167 TaxID=1176127 RepID=A0A6A6AWF3_9PEZI|nr:uncharacterized protein K452DRAFT_347550 [Aplosporella prunicola CBS 121167]KAF2135588.1 hypothetical protein K452DRAFT_347550 [Aplosporella prunicola CBS 121167]
MEGPLSEGEHFKNAKVLVREWCQLITDPHGHLERLDDSIGKRLDFRLKDISDIPENLVNQALGLLKRIPTSVYQPHSISNDSALNRLDTGFLAAEPSCRTLESLKVAHFVDLNSIKMALKVFIAVKRNLEKREGYAGTDFETYIAFIAELLRTTFEIAKETWTRTGRLFVLRVFLWQA